MFTEPDTKVSHHGSTLGFPEFTRIMARGGKDIKLCRENMLQMFFKASVDFGEGGNKMKFYGSLP